MERSPLIRSLIKRETQALMRTEYDPADGVEKAIYTCDSEQCLFIERTVPPSSHIQTRIRRKKGMWRTVSATSTMVVIADGDDDSRHYHAECWRKYRGE